MRGLLLSLLPVVFACHTAIGPDGDAIRGVESGDLLCADLVDNDADGALDCEDADCAGAAVCDARPLVERACTDGEDDDGDGRVDCADPDCADHLSCGAESGTACGDGVDNDLDGVTDCLDPGCAEACGGADTDGDGALDELELAMGTDPLHPDTDGDGVLDGVELGLGALALDSDLDGKIDALESRLLDCDGDGVADEADGADMDQPEDDRDDDGIPNADDPDDDNDGVCDPDATPGAGCVLVDGQADLCPWAPSTAVNIVRADDCDLDPDGDGVLSGLDLCPHVADPEQRDTDGDGFGDLCDAAPADPSVVVDALSVPGPCDGSGDDCDLLIEEVLYRVTAAGGALAIDANGDGEADALDDEFIEVRNTSGFDLDLSGLEIHDDASRAGNVPARHRVPAGTILRRGGRLVVFGGGAPASCPESHTVVQTASSGSLSLNNTGDTLTLVSGPEELARVSFDEEDAASNASLTRYPEGLSTWRSHDSLPARASPGVSPDR